MTIQEAIEFIEGTEGEIFAIEFIKRSNGERRRMACRTGVYKGRVKGAPTYNAAEHGLIRVFDMGSKVLDYRTIPIEGIRRICINKVWQEVTHEARV